MAQAATPGELGLPCSPKQALALYKHLFWCPAGLGQLQAALRQLLWDLELLTGAGLGLFWPPRAQFCGLRDQAQSAWSQHSKPRGRTGGGSEQLTSGVSRGADPSSAPDLDNARSETDARWESAGISAEPTPGCLQELSPTISSSFGEPGSSEFKDLDQKEERGQAEPTTQRPRRPSSGSLQGRRLTQEAPRLSGLPSQGLPEPPGPPEGLGWSLGQDRADLQKLLIEIPQGQREKTNQGQSGEATQSLMEEVSGGPNRPECQRKEALLERSKETPQAEEVKILQSSGGGGQISQAWEVAHGEAPTQPQEKGDSLGTPGDFCRSLGEQVPQPGGRESPGPSGRSTQLMQDKNEGQRPESALALGEQGTGLEEAPAPLPSPRPPAPPLLPGPGAVMLAPLSTGASGQQERPTALPGHPGLVSNRHGLQDSGVGPGPAEQQVGEERGLRAGGSAKLPGALGERRGGAEAPKASKAAWSEPPGTEASVGVSTAQRETALQRLLELHRAAKHRRRQDREQQRLRVLERLRIARNRHCQVHPLAPPPSPAQLPSQEDAARQRRALREQLERVHRERTGRLRALRARNTQNFQQLLWSPGAEEPAPGE
ncbi:hypothetical protein mRhiFer1_009429 [Rhinolophus ferrumequinum]|uniref:Uncharacterized protein n=1 Tax=Rhinolophus ferrumequinum TaxID=59479 RepID=A0A7J7RJ06_RHIFE|nr:hypothetical protein mRhiFer1_009429 [Rhinolophus ferrumequinum]